MARHDTDDFGDGAAEESGASRVDAAVEQARSAAGNLADALPGAAATAGDAARQVQAQVGSMSYEGLAVGSALSLGAALGLLISGSNRLLVLMALLPAIVMGSYLVNERQGTQRRARLH